MSDLVRAARETDAPGMHDVHRRSWLETYAGLITTDAIEARFRNADARIARWEETIRRGSVIVAERDGRVVGWAITGSGRGDEPPRPLELEGIYLLAAAHGSGLGQALLDEAIGDRPAFLWVAEGNARAIAFYRRNGFDVDGARDEHRVGDEVIVVVRMVR